MIRLLPDADLEPLQQPDKGIRSNSWRLQTDYQTINTKNPNQNPTEVPDHVYNKQLEW